MRVVQSLCPYVHYHLNASQLGNTTVYSFLGQGRYSDGLVSKLKKAQERSNKTPSGGDLIHL